MRPLKPILFIAFANNVESPTENLDGLRREYANIRAAFALHAGGDGSCELLTNAACTGDGLVEPFYRNQVVIFHYAGHASPDALLLQTADGRNAPASRDRFAQFLALQSRLRLVFLNACMTREWAEQLVRLGVCVVATSRCIPDSIAPDFANAFYREIAQDRTIAEAFEEASRGCASAKENDAEMRGFAAAEDDHATEGLPWALYGSEAARTWRLSDDAHDPAIGLPPLDPAKYPLPRKSPYVTIEGHQEKDVRIFFGRNAEVRCLYDWIMKPTAQPLLIFYGQSGVGKSSLLRAGLLPRLSGPEVIQYARHGADLGADLNKALAAQAASDGEWLASAVPRVIVLDQVEEAILHGGKDEMSRFADRLKELFAAYPKESKARLILSFRKEYLAEMRALLAEHLPGLATELFLERLDQEGIRQVVLGPMRSQDARDLYRLKITEEFAQFVADKLDDGRSSVATVLQIILGRLWEEAKKRADECGAAEREYTEPLYRDVVSEAKGPLTQFLDQQMARLRDRGWQAEVDGGLELDLLLEHTTDFTTARRIPAEDLQRKCYPDVRRLAALVEDNKKLHLLSEVQDEPCQPVATSLSHDQLAIAVRAQWNLSQLPGARARRIIENGARSWGETKGGDPLDGADLRVVERGLAQMRALDPKKHETEMVAASRERRRKRRQAWIVWPSVTAIVIGGVVGLALANRSARDRIRSLNQRAAQELAANNPGADAFVSLLLSMEAVREARNSWVFRLSPDRKARDAARATLQDALVAPHDSGRYEFDYLDAFGEVGACATAFDDSGRLLLRTFADRGRNTRIREVSVGGRRIPDDMVDPDQLLESGCDPLNRRFGVLGFEGPRLWQDGTERNVKLAWIFDLKDATRMALSPDGHYAAFGSTGFLPAGSAKTDMSWVVLASMDTGESVEIHPDAGIPVGLAFSPDFSILAVTGPKAMVWLDAKTGRNVLRCPGNYGALGFARAGGQEFAAVINMASPNWPSVEFWKLPLSANPGMTQCHPFDFYQPADYSGYTDDRLTAIAFDKSGTHFAVGRRKDYGTADPDNNATLVEFYAVPSSLSGNALPDPRHTHPFPKENIGCTGCPPPRPAGEMHEFPDPIASFYLPTTGDTSERPLKADIIAIGVNGDRSAFAFLQQGSSVVRVWPAQQLNLSKPLSADNLFSIACSELKVYLSEDDRFRVKPAASEGVDLHALHAGCIAIPKPVASVTH